MPTITTFISFNDQAEAAASLYLSVFEDGKITSRMPGPNNTVMGVELELLGRSYIFLNGGPSFNLTEAISLFVSCDTQAEVDRYWAKLTADGGRESRCGWLKDKFGVSWQVIPKKLGQLLGHENREGAGRALQAMLGMQKIDIATLQKAFDGK